MALGAYSIVRFSDNMRDERVNIGVIVWHPTQGFSHIIPRSMDRAKAINPHLDVGDIRQQRDFLIGELDADRDGCDTLVRLSQVLSEGFQVSAPYPTRLAGASECAQHLFRLLVTKPQANQARAARELPVRERLFTDLRDVSLRIDPQAIVENLGERYIADVRVNLGTRTSVGARNYLWRMVSLNTGADDQVSRAKATAMDISKIRGLEEFRSYFHAVAVHTPRKQAGDALKEAQAWLGQETKSLILFRNPSEIEAEVRKVLTRPSQNPP